MDVLVSLLFLCLLEFHRKRVRKKSPPFRFSFIVVSDDNRVQHLMEKAGGRWILDELYCLLRAAFFSALFTISRALALMVVVPVSVNFVIFVLQTVVAQSIFHMKKISLSVCVHFYSLNFIC